jgi:hypothetical protein
MLTSFSFFYLSLFTPLLPVFPLTLTVITIKFPIHAHVPPPTDSDKAVRLATIPAIT